MLMLHREYGLGLPHRRVCSLSFLDVKGSSRVRGERASLEKKNKIKKTTLNPEHEAACIVMQPYLLQCKPERLVNPKERALCYAGFILPEVLKASSVLPSFSEE